MEYNGKMYFTLKIKTQFTIYILLFRSYILNVMGQNITQEIKRTSIEIR